MLTKIKSWYHEDKKDILWTVVGAVLSTVLGLLCQHWLDVNPHPNDLPQKVFLKLIPYGKSFIDFICMSDLANYGIQSAFIFIALCILIHGRTHTLREIRNEDQITDYILQNCNVRTFNNADNHIRYKIIEKATRDFHTFWIIVWAIWFAYYFGNFCFCLIEEFAKSKPTTPPDLQFRLASCQTIYSQTLDYISSTVLLLIYGVLTNLTLKKKDIDEESSNLWVGGIFLIFLTIGFVVGVINETLFWRDVDSIHINVVSVALSVYAAISLILVLGKITSNYLKIPTFFLICMYFYAVIQCYIPFRNESNTPSAYFYAIVPYLTLFGKVFILLSLCWMSYQKRLIFFLIHRRSAMESIPRLLSNLNRELVNY